MPKTMGRRAAGNRSLASAMAAGMSAPPPTAWTTRAPMSQPSEGARATSADPAPKTSVAPMYSRR